MTAQCTLCSHERDTHWGLQNWLYLSELLHSLTLLPYQLGHSPGGPLPEFVFLYLLFSHETLVANLKEWRVVGDSSGVVKASDSKYEG